MKDRKRSEQDLGPFTSAVLLNFFFLYHKGERLSDGMDWVSGFGFVVLREDATITNSFSDMHWIM
jgi:hypothetical protein